VSLKAQQDRIRAWAQQNGREIMGECHDNGISGKNLKDRPGARDAITLACENHAALVVYSLSRLARSTKDAIEIGERLAKAGSDLVSLSEQIDTTTAAGKMIFRLLAVLAEFERDLVGERTRTALQHMRANGKVVGTLPYGFQRNGDSLIDNPAEQKVLTMMLMYAEAGRKPDQIAAELTAAKVWNREGKPWHPRSIRRILASQDT
jgi:DNA invertase Pin-like site-specific DNA recombinase